MPIYDFYCITAECPENTGFSEGIPNRKKELFVGMNDEPECEVCGSKLQKLIGCPMGYVKGTETYCRGGRF